MSLRDAYTAIHEEHQPTHDPLGHINGTVPGTVFAYECRSGCLANVTLQDCINHVIDAQIAYLRDHLAQHGEELGMTREQRFDMFTNHPYWNLTDGCGIETTGLVHTGICYPCDVRKTSGDYDAVQQWIQTHVEDVHDTTGPPTQSRFVTGWGRADEAVREALKPLRELHKDEL